MIVIFCAGVSAQSLQILPSPPASADASFRIMLVSPGGKAPLGLQWNLLLPAGVALKKVVAGEAAAALKKAVTCSSIPAETKDGTGSQYRCVLAGGQSPLPDGPMAVVTCNMRQGLREATIRLTKTIGVTEDLKQVNLEDTQATITGQ
jgi:hypothetical protein